MLDVVQLKILSCSSSNFKIIEAIVVSIICSPLSGQFSYPRGTWLNTQKHTI